MPAMSWDGEAIAGPHVQRRNITFQKHLGLPFKYHDPFSLLLVVPVIRGARLPMGDDPLDAQVLAPSEDFDYFGGEIFGQLSQ